MGWFQPECSCDQVYNCCAGFSPWINVSSLEILKRQFPGNCDFFVIHWLPTLWVIKKFFFAIFIDNFSNLGFLVPVLVTLLRGPALLCKVSDLPTVEALSFLVPLGSNGIDLHGLSSSPIGGTCSSLPTGRSLTGAIIEFKVSTKDAGMFNTCNHSVWNWKLSDYIYDDISPDGMLQHGNSFFIFDLSNRSDSFPFDQEIFNWLKPLSYGS